jgi:hypothetical protein
MSGLPRRCHEVLKGSSIVNRHAALTAQRDLELVDSGNASAGVRSPS